MTSFLDRLRGRPVIEHQPSASMAKAVYGGDWLAAYQAGGIPLSSLNSDPQAKAARLLQAYRVGWFNKAERKISTDFAGLEVTVAPEDNEGENQDSIVEPDLLAAWDTLGPVEQFLRLMEKPNPYQTGRQLRQRTMIRLDMAGWAFWYTELGSDGLPVENGLYGISPSRLWPSYDKTGQLIGYVLDKNREGGGVPFETEEIVPFSYGSADDDYVYGVGVVEAVWAQVPLTDLMAKHTADVLTTGGRLAGAMWPKNRALDEGEFEDAKRAWRSVASDPNAARRLLLFPEPMEWSAGASTPTEIGIPELAVLNRDDILTAFPISPYQLGVPMPGGLNSAAVREEDRRDYWENALHPRVELFEETVQTYLMSKYEKVMGTTLDFEIAEPNLDDASRLIEKVGALDGLITAGFDEKEAVAAVGLDHIKYNGKPAPPPPRSAVGVTDSGKRGVNETVTQPVSGQPSTPQTKAAEIVGKTNAVRDRYAEQAKGELAAFLTAQRARVESGIRTSYVSVKAHPTSRKAWAAKADPDWWNAQQENDRLTEVMRGIYLEIGRGGLQAVADTLNRSMMNRFVSNVLTDLLTYGGERIKDINERTLQALTLQLAEGTRRGYSINQLIDGVPDEGFAGIGGVTLDNGVPAFDEYRAEMIARTETTLSYNRATVDGYGEFGVTTLLAYDGDGDEECANRDGQEFSVDEALDIEDHPNGTLVWSPVVDKAVHLKPNHAPNVTVNLHMAETSFKAEMAPPSVTVEPADVHVDVHVPELTPPTVNVTTPAPDVHVNVEATKAPDIHVDVQPTPVTVDLNVPDVTIKAAAPVINVTTPDTLRITSMPDRMTKRVVKRDNKGAITESTDIEVDA